ncbi:filamentous hemagglutinin N-terminal domain-containing protein [Pseudanabaena sp. PCC 6802]|uniref:two-partner secretion domain-containing protein n=1 Tax=Pseudanabaena sp. PCC 6802 TaxID=118173 RepID=UPI00138AB0A7|nr:filamentous hemagglutinin N-terminal domain-containing protein [Pseudanabaena sp. PCC 6802]
MVNQRRKSGVRVVSSAICVACSAIAPTLVTDPAFAQIVPDRTLGDRNSVVVPNVIRNGVAIDRIDGGAVRGSNLFHSFQQFNINLGQRVYFNNPSGIANIFSRVTGGNVSNIDGVLGVLGNANLFLLNPSGIIFGPNARLDVGGSFVASTANSIKFGDGIEFSATESQTPPLLTISVPTGLQFGNTAAKIVTRSQADNVGLQVPTGKTLALVGGDLDIAGGFLTAERGRIELGSVAPTSLVSLAPIPQGWLLGYQGVNDFQDIKLSQLAFVDTTDRTTNNGGGDIQVQGRQLLITEGSAIQATTLGALPGGNIQVTTTDSIEVVGKSQGFNSGIAATVCATGIDCSRATGNGGDISLITKLLSVRDGAQITTNTFGSGRAGNLIVKAARIELVGTDGEIASGLFASSNSFGNSGNLTIDAQRLLVLDGAIAQVTTFSSGKAGDLTVNANTIELNGAYRRSSDRATISGGLKASSDINSTGNGGNLVVNAGRFTILNGAEAQSSTLGSGRAGTVTVKASELVELSGRTFDNRFASAIRTASGLEGVTTTATGQAGDVTIAAPTVIVRNGAEIKVSATGTGAAGNLNIDANLVRLDRQGTLQAETRAGDRGNINLQTRDSLQLLRNSNISANAFGTATGGNVFINATTLAALQNSDISANAEFAFGGRVIANVPQGYFNTPDSEITATSALGQEFNGVVEIRTPDIDASKGLVTLSLTPVDVSKLIAQRCLADRKGNEFIITGRGGLPTLPNDLLRTNSTLEDLGREESLLKSDRNSPVESSAQSSESSHLNSASQAEIITEAQQWAIAKDGKVVLLSQVPHSQSPGHAIGAITCPK